ncbi:shikimate kinase, chloroplastic-like [Dorcoceras hygrometricum]|uniref:Shikimate kinase, chloroplastic-like n=1 Tax=Dorcoceras hygrometricum TaxID=472368 RepID=A0A2Z7C602_9LAMI|nr:shikimate kinase, chloroplastic-like [Dorcoceras hygrometricum]
MVKRLETSPHDPLGITDSACKNQLVMVRVQYDPFNSNIPIESMTIGKSRVARDSIAMHTSWKSNSDITCATSIGYHTQGRAMSPRQRSIDSYMHRDLTHSRNLMTPTEKGCSARAGRHELNLYGEVCLSTGLRCKEHQAGSTSLVQEQFRDQAKKYLVKSRTVQAQIKCSVQVWCSSAETGCFSERLDEIEVTPFDGDEEESVCKGYLISLHRTKLAWKNASWISTSHQIGIDPDKL